MKELISSGLNGKKKYMRVPELWDVYSIKQGVAYRLIDEGLIKSISLAEGKARRGTRLIEVESVEKYLARLALAQSETPAETEKEAA